MKALKNPPKWALGILRFYSGDARIEEIEGDLFELYNEFIVEKGPRFAPLYFFWLVIRNFRSYAFKRSTMKNKRIPTFMMFFRHNLAIASRDLLKNRSTSLINMLGLTIGLAAFIVIYHIIAYELSFNKEIPEQERIFRVYTNFEGLNGNTFTNPGVPIPLGEHIRENASGVALVAEFHNFWSQVDVPLGNGQQKTFEEDQTAILLADTRYFQIANQYTWISGSQEHALNKPYQVVLTETQARVYFDDTPIEEIIGHSIVYRDSLEVFVSGIVRGPEFNSDFDFTEFISFSTIDASWLKDRYGDDRWDNVNSSTQVWVKLDPLSDRVHLDNELIRISDELAAKEEDNVWRRDFRSQSIGELHFNTLVGIFDSSRSVIHLKTLKVLGGVAALLLLIAIFNFINLETAQMHTKLKEVGIRKVIGSTRRLLVGRFMVNAILISLLSILLALPLSLYTISLFEDFVPEGLYLDLTDPTLWSFLLVVGIVVGLFAGLYPSLLVSTYTPASALRQGLSKHGKNNKSYLRKSFITFQFVFSQFLIIATIIVLAQINFMLEKDLGFDQEGVVLLKRPWYSPTDKQFVLRNELDQIPEIKTLSLHGMTPAHQGWSTTTLSHVRNDIETNHRAHNRSGDSLYFALYRIDMLAGRMPTHRKEGNEIVINEIFRKELGYETNTDALGARLGDDNIVVGVTADYHTQSLHYSVEPTIFRFSDENVQYFGMRINQNGDLAETIEKIAAAWDQVYPDAAFSLEFMDESIRRFYESEQRTSKLASTATGIAIFISCLGLFGLISFTTVQRTKEIGIRKVLGASILQIGNVITREFLVLMFMALLVSIPLAYYFASQWLSDFSFRIDLEWWIFPLGGLISMLIAGLTIGFKIWKASTANPVESLRYE